MLALTPVVQQRLDNRISYGTIPYAILPHHMVLRLTVCIYTMYGNSPLAGHPPSLPYPTIMNATKLALPATRRKMPEATGDQSTADASPVDAEFEHEPLGYLVRHAHRAFARVLSERLLEHDISSGQWTALRALWREDGYSQVELAQRIRVEKASLTALLESLEKKGLIRRERCEEDKRRWNVHLTKPGHALEAVLMPIAPEIEKLAIKGLTKDESATLRKLLVKVWNNLE